MAEITKQQALQELARRELSKRESSKKTQQPQLETVNSPSLFNEFMKANEQVSAGARANLQGRSFESGFNQPGSVPRFADTYSQGVMNTLEKSKFMREHPNIESLAYNSIGKPAGLVGATIDSMTDPVGIAGGIVGAGLVKPVMSGAAAMANFASRKGGQFASKLGFNYPEQLAALQSKEAMIANTASREIGATEAQIKYNIGNLEQSKAQSMANMTNLTKEAEKLNAQAIAGKEAQKTALGTKLPDVAYASGQKLKDRFIGTIKKHSDLYSKKLDGLLGGKNSDIYIETDKVLNSIEESLLDRSVPTSINDKGKLILESTASPAEKRLANVYNKLQGTDSVSVKDLIRNKQMLGRGVSYGKAYGYEDDLVNDVVQRFGSRIEKELPGMKELNKETSKFLSIKDEANARLDLFSKKGSTKPRTFIESFAKSEMTPEERVFLEKLKTELPDFDRLAKAPRALGEGMKQYDDAVKMLKNKDPKVVAKITADFDTEIAKLNSNLDIIKSRISNQAGAESKPIQESILKIEKKIKKIKKVKDIIVALGSVGGTGALGYGAIRAMNYGYNATFRD